MKSVFTNNLMYIRSMFQLQVMLQECSRKYLSNDVGDAPVMPQEILQEVVKGACHKPHACMVSYADLNIFQCTGMSSRDLPLELER